MHLQTYRRGVLLAATAEAGMCQELKLEGELQQKPAGAVECAAQPAGTAQLAGAGAAHPVAHFAEELHQIGAAECVAHGARQGAGQPVAMGSTASASAGSDVLVCGVKGAVDGSLNLELDKAPEQGIGQQLLQPVQWEIGDGQPAQLPDNSMDRIDGHGS